MGAALFPSHPDFDRRTAPMHVSAPVYCEPKLQEPRQHPPPYKNIWFYMSFAMLRYVMLTAVCNNRCYYVSSYIFAVCCANCVSCFNMMWYDDMF